MPNDDILTALRRAQPRWLAERRGVIQGTGLRPSRMLQQPTNLVRNVIITPLYDGGAQPVNAEGEPPGTPPPQTPQWPNPFPDDVTHTPFPEPGTVDFVGLVVHGQDVGYPNSYGAFAADVFNLFGHHTDPVPYMNFYAWDLSLGSINTIGNINFWRVDAYFGREYTGPQLAVYTHSGLSAFYGGPPAYELWQEDYGPW